MKSFPLLLTSLIIITSLEARENPFMPTKAYENEVARLIEIDQNQPAEYLNTVGQSHTQYPSFYHGTSYDNGKEDMTPVITEEEKNKLHEKAIEMSEKQMAMIQKEKDAKLEKERQLKNALKKVEMAKKEAQKAKMEKEKAIQAKKALEEKGPVIYVKPRAKAMNETVEKKVENPTTMENIQEESTMQIKSMEILPFLKVEYSNDKFIIDTPHKIIKKFYLPGENKLIIDFKADVTFYTKRVDIQSANFKKVIAGNHKKENYFRVVVLVEEQPSMYDITFDDDLVYITSKK